jgi:hypothetical protein
MRASLGLALLCAAVPNPDARGGDVAELGSTEAIARFTSDPRFLSPWVAYVPDSKTVPSPTKFLGHVAGAPGELTSSGRIHAYFRALDAASPRVQVEVIGKTEEGREILLAAIADETGIRDLARLKSVTAALSDPRRTSLDEAERLVASGRPIYYVNAGLHADETGSPEMALELAYRLAVSEEPMIQAIRRSLVVLINPVSEPDGRDKTAEWFVRYLKGRTDYDTLPRQSPPYWGRYVYVDVNRDAHQKALEVTRAVHRMFHDYHPTVVHDLHEAIAFLMTWNGTGPYNPNLDPITTSEFLEMSFHEVTRLSALGMPGVWTWKFGEGFGHHYLDSVAMNHNSLGRGYETWGNATAETMERVLDASDTTREWYRPWPPSRRFRWSMRDNTNYMQTALLAVLDYSARHAGDLLRSFHRKGHNSWRKGVEQAPFAYVIPEEQGDRRRVAQMVARLMDQGIEVGRATAPLTVGGAQLPAGTYVLKLDQPYRNYAVDLMEPQVFPGDAENLPYDDVSWALPVHYGVDVRRVDDREAARAIGASPLREPPHPTGRVSGSGPVYLLKETGQEALLAARHRLSDFAVEIAEAPFASGGASYPAGSWVLPAKDGLGAALEAVAAELGLDFQSAAASPDVARHAAAVPRLGVWVPWADTDSIGWIRYTLDQQKVPYVYLRDEDLRAGGLRDRVDVVLYGQVRLDLQGQIHGIAPVAGPMPFTRTAEFPSHGAPAASDDITGGPGWAGLANLQRFVEEGGVLVTLGSGTALALDAGLARNVRRAEQNGVFTPGVELRATFLQASHPVAYGYPRVTSAFRTNLPVYDPPRRWLEMSYCTSCLDGPVDRRFVVMQWGTRPLAGDEELGSGPDVEPQPLVVSGGARGEKALEGRPAILDVPVGKGRVVAFNFNPMHRDLNRSDYRFLWNVILNWSGLPRMVP